MERLTLGRDREGRVVFSDRTRRGALVPPPHTLFLETKTGACRAETSKEKRIKRSNKSRVDPRRNRRGGGGSKKR